MNPSLLRLFFPMWEMADLVLGCVCCWQRGKKPEINPSSLNLIIEKEELMFLTKCFPFSLNNKGKSAL